MLSELCTLVRIPSISFPGFEPKEVDRSAEATADLLKRVGYQNVEILTLNGSFPYVVGDFIVDPELPTALLYAHHDVQPPGREEFWKTKPFDPVEKNGRLYGRGTADDKAGVMVHVGALKYYVDLSGKPPINLKVIIEGEEEVGSDNLLPFLKKYHDRLKADVIIVTDTGNIDSGVPSLTTSLRGLVCVEVVVESLKAPLHSGLWGGGVVDPAHALVKILAELTDEKGQIKLKSIKKAKVREVSDIPLTREEFAKQAGVLKSNSVPEDFLQRVWYEPSFSINAIQASSEKLANNSIADRAFARVGIRITENEKAEDVLNELTTKLKELCPSSLELSFRFQTASNAWAVDVHQPKHRWAFKSAEAALEKAFGKKTVYIGCGASIPFIGPFEEALKAPVITIGVEDPYTLAHSENESMLLSDFYKAIEGEVLLFENLRENFKQRGR